jgi:hypothetical protein
MGIAMARTSLSASLLLLLLRSFPMTVADASFPAFRAVNWSLVTAAAIAEAEAALTSPIGCSCVSTR